MFKVIADNRQPDSWASKMRKRRFALFCHLLSQIDAPIRILDVGGTIAFWESMNLPLNEGLEITILNQAENTVENSKYTYIKGNACKLDFNDNEFDVIFSNSVIEHVGGWEKQKAMADEIMRVGKRYFIQTPNKNFPLEPHFLFPFFQFFPLRIKTWILMHFDLGWFKHQKDKKTAEEIVKSIALLTVPEFKDLFPGSVLVKEKLFGITKSVIVYKWWVNQTEKGIGK